MSPRKPFHLQMRITSLLVSA